MKRVLSVILILASILLVVSCAENDNSKINDTTRKATMICPDGLPAIAMSKFIDDDNKIGDIDLECSIQKTADLLSAELAKGEADLAIVPSNLALQAYKKNLGYKIAATIGWGSLYLVSTEDVEEISELRGCEIYNIGKGLTPDIVFRNILINKGLDENEINFSYVGSASELAPMIITGKVKYAVLPEPVLSTVMSKNDNIKVLLDLNEEWRKINNVEKGYPQSTLLIKKEFYNEIKDNGQYEKIMKKIKKDEEWVKNNPQLAAEKSEKMGITVNKDVINVAIKNSNLDFTEIDESILEYEKYFSTIDTESKGEKNEYDAMFIKK